MLAKLHFTCRAMGIGLVALGLAVPAAAAGPSRATKAEAGKRLVDPVNQISLQVPEGWHVLAPPADSVVGIVTLTNYRPLSPDALESSLPEDAVKIEIQVLPRTGQSLKAWNTGRLRALEGEDSFAPGYEAGEAVTYKLARRAALAYTIHGEGLAPVLGISVDWTRDKVLSATVRPADSPALGRALAVLDGLDAVGGSRSDRAREQKRLGRESDGFLEPVEGLIRRIPTGSGVFVAEAGSCPAGTFDLGEAPASPITLSLPFASGSWEVGNIGSYFGNGLHCNSNNDYYATDWNRRSASCAAGYLEDNGQEVRPVASGTVTRADCTDPSGYGCQVQVTHSNGLRSRYAHLSAVSVSVNAAVTTATKLGEVGCSGLASCGPHLHLSLLQSVNGTYYSKCNGPLNRTTCPNGEAKSGVQTVKPSPMVTASGSTNLQDGGCYTVGSGGGTGWSQTIDNTDAACTLGGPSQYWYPVSGYGINGSMHYTWNAQSSGSNFVFWNFSIPTSANYKLQVYIPSNHATTTSARYYVHNGTIWLGPYTVNQNNYFNQWVDLATVYLPAGTRTLHLTDVTGEATGTKKVGADAARAIRQ